MPLGPSYRRLFCASAVSNLGDGVFSVALPLVAVGLTRDPTAIAGVSLALRLPWLVFSLTAGALVDRWDRRRVLWITDLVRALIVAGLGTAIALDVDSLVVLYAVAAALGTAETLFDNASQTIVPSLVPDSADLPRANGRLYAVETITNSFVGPPLGGLLVAVAVALPFWVDAGSFAVAALLVAGIGGSFHPAGDDPGPRRRLATEIAEGVRWLWRHRALRDLALLLGLMNLWLMAGFSVLVLFATERLGLGEVGFGLLGTAGALGSVAGGFLGPRLARRIGTARLLVLGALGTAAAQVAMAPLTEPVVAGAVLAAGGFVGTVWNVVTVSLRQSLIPDRLLGRVNSVYRFLGWGACPWAPWRAG